MITQSLVMGGVFGMILASYLQKRENKSVNGVANLH